jgi:DNA-binding NtrC family response regulator
MTTQAPAKRVAAQRLARPLPELVSYLEGLPEPHILFDRRYRILAANAAYRREFSPSADVVGRTCHEVSHRFSQPCDQCGETCPLTRARTSGQRERVLHLHHTPQGEAYVNIELVPVCNSQGEQAYFIEKMEPLATAVGPSAGAAMIGRSAAYQAMLSLVARVAPSQANVLLLGESGTGKELLARAIHQASARAAAPLVVVDCASLPEALFESELFGHERGAFTGAHASKPGLVEAASGGTLFLDEVGDIPLAMQVKLLRLLESGTYRRVGSNELRHTNLRLLAATHRDLPDLVARNAFRADLFYRLSTFPIRLPALRERVDDIPLLAAALLTRVAPQRRLSLSRTALAALCAHPFPGNIRELRNVLERAALMTDGTSIDLHALQQALAVAGAALAPADAAPPVGNGNVGACLRDAEREAEHSVLRAALHRHAGSRAELARQLGISERSLYRKLKEMADTGGQRPGS